MGRRKLTPVYVDNVEVQSLGQAKKTDDGPIWYRHVIVMVTLQTDPVTTIPITVSGMYYPNEEHKWHRFDLDAAATVEIDHQWSLLGSYDNWKIVTHGPNIYCRVERAISAAIENQKQPQAK